MEALNVALVQMCVDDRLDHARIRAQVADKLREVHLRADRVFLLNEIGGNVGQNFRNTLDLFIESGASVVFCAILHHDDCAADKAGRRVPMEQSVAEMAIYITEKGVSCPVYSGNIRTDDNTVRWRPGRLRTGSVDDIAEALAIAEGEPFKAVPSG